jgi:tRNA(Ile)-lysidine synthase
MAVVSVNLEDRVAEILTRYNMLPAAGTVGVAVSGGADSVALLHLLHRRKLPLRILHVNHKLRGAESEGDEKFVRELGHDLGVKVQVAQAPVTDGNVEQEAREARRKFFLESMEKFGLCRVALGHNRGDQAETVLYRLLRGSGLSGLAGMRPVTADGLIRPLLTFSREEIRNWACVQEIRWREDSTNQSQTFARNRLRHETIPALAERFNPNLEALLADNAAVAQDEEDCWNLRIEAIFGQITKRNELGSFFQIRDLAELHPAEQRRFLRRTVREVKGDLRSIDLQHIEAIRQLTASEAAHDRVIVPGIDALRSFGTLLLSPPGTIGKAPRHYDVRVNLGEEVSLPFTLGSIYVNWVKTGGRICANFGEADQIDLEVADLDGDVVFGENLTGSLSARNWEPGDQMERAAGRKPEKLKSLFQEFRVLLWERRSWPVVMAGEEIVWSRCFGSAAKFKANEESRNIVRLIYRAADLSGVGSILL